MSGPWRAPASTLEPARYLGATDSLGTIAPGKLADLVLLDADPLVDIRHTTRIHAVVADGRFYYRRETATRRGQVDGAVERAMR
jgi:imidazolonepropionase-like amidohydrolase